MILPEADSDFYHNKNLAEDKQEELEKVEK
jgi:hypothetical protein